MATKVYFINSADAKYSDEEFAWFQSLMLLAGVIGDPDTGAMGFEVSENAVPDMSVLVTAGKALVEVTIAGRTFKVVADSNATEQLAVPANATGNTRVDAVILKVRTDIEPNANKNNIVTLEVITGSGATPLTDSAINALVLNASWYRIANIATPNSATSIINSYLTDTRVKAKFSDGFGFQPAFINESEASVDPTDDEGKIVKLEANGKIAPRFLPEVDFRRLVFLNRTFGNTANLYNITDMGSGIFRYTYVSGGVNPNFTTELPVGLVLNITATGFNVANRGVHIVTNFGANYFEVFNPAGMAQASVTVSGGSIVGHNEWTKPVGLKRLFAQVQAGGGSGGANSSNGNAGNNSSFASLLAVRGGGGFTGSGSGVNGQVGGEAYGGHLNIRGGPSSRGSNSTFQGSSYGGGSYFGHGGVNGGHSNQTTIGGGWGFGGSTDRVTSSTVSVSAGAGGGYCERLYSASELSSTVSVVVGNGGAVVGDFGTAKGGDGIIILTEFYA